MAYKPQYYPGNTSVARNRRKHMSNDLEILRDISDEDLTAILGHRAPGSDYPSTHPPLAEMGEPDCSIREIVEPTPGAVAGDRVRYVQFADSMYNAPATPYWRSYHAAINFRGVDPGTLSGRQVNEMRERDLEEYARRQCETEITDWGLSGMRGCTVHGHSLRLQEDGTMFDMLDRRRLEGGVMVMDKDQVGVPIDRKVNLGKPMSEAETARRTTIYRADNVPFRSDKEVIEHVATVWERRTKYGFQPRSEELEAALQRIRTRIKEDPEFVKLVKSDPLRAFDEYGITKPFAVNIIAWEAGLRAWCDVTICCNTNCDCSVGTSERIPFDKEVLVAIGLKLRK